MKKTLLSRLNKKDAEIYRMAFNRLENDDKIKPFFKAYLEELYFELEFHELLLISSGDLDCIEINFINTEQLYFDKDIDEIILFLYKVIDENIIFVDKRRALGQHSIKMFPINQLDKYVTKCADNKRVKIYSAKTIYK